MSAVLNPVTVPTTVTNPHVLEAQARVEELRLMRQTIPNFFIPEAASDILRLNSAASVPPELIELAAMAITNSPALVRGEGMTPAEMRDRLAYADAYGPLADELEALAKFVRFSIVVAKNESGNAALTTYALAQRLSKRPETAHLAPHVAAMRRVLSRGKTRAAARRRTTPPAPATPALPSAPTDPPS